MKKTVLLSMLFAITFTGCGMNSLSSGSNTVTPPPSSTPAAGPQGDNNNSGDSTTPSSQQGTTQTQNANPTSSQTQNNDTPNTPVQQSTSNQTPTQAQPVPKDHPSAGSGQVIGNPPPSESITADEVVAQFYSDLGSKQYKSAWTWLYKDDELSQPYEKFSAQKQPAALVSVSKPTYLDSYTFRSFNKTLNHVAVVTAKFSDGSTKTIHAVMDDQGWRLAWNPNDGLE